MKKIIWILFLLGSAVVCIAQPGYPINLRNVIIGYQTTPEGLFFRGSHSPNHIPLEKYGTFMYVDTVTRQIWMYLDKDTVNGQPVGVWAKMYPSVSDLSSLTDVNTTGKIQNSMLIYDAVTSKWIIDNGTVYRKTTDTLSGQVYGAYNNTKLDSVSALYFDLDTPPVTLGVGMLSWDATTGTASLGLLGGNVQLKVGQQLVKRVVNKTTTNVNLLKSEYKVVKLLGATGSRISVDLAQANNEAGSAGTLGVVIEDINNNQEGFILVAGEITNINTTGTLVGESWNEGDVLYLSATTPGALTKVKPTPPNHTVIVGWVESVNANNGKIYVKIDNGYELEELHNVLTTGKTNGSILYYDNDNGLWKASTGITLDNAGTLALNAVTVNTLMYVDADKKLRSVTLTTTGSSGAATFSNGTLNIPQYAGSTDLSTAQSGANVNLNSSTGSDITLIPGGGTTLTSGGSGTNVTISSSNIYNSNGSIPAATTRTVTLAGNSPGGNTTLLEFKQNTGTGKTTFNGGSILIDKPSNTAPTDQSLEVNALSIEGRSVIGGVTEKSGIVLAEGAVELRSNAVPIGNAGSPALKVNADNTVSLSTLGTVTSGSGVRLLFREADGVLTDQLVINGSSYLALNRLLPSQASNANKYLKTNGTDVSWADAGVSSVTASSPLFSSGGANPNITIQQANTSQSGFLSSIDWNTFNNKQSQLNGIGFVKASGTTITYDNSTYLTSETGVTSFSAGTTGFTPSSATNGAITLAGTLAIANGGTNATTASAAINNLLPSQTTHANKYLRTDGTNVSWQTVTAGISGSGTANKIPKWTDGSTLGSSVIEESAGGDIGIGKTPDAGFKLDVNGTVKATRFIVNTFPSNVLSINNYAPSGTVGNNLWIGSGGQSSSGTSGASGSLNAGIGDGALFFNTTGFYNLAFGVNALLRNTTGNLNVSIGGASSSNNLDGSGNTAIGGNSLSSNTSGSFNIAIGYTAMNKKVTGSDNVAIGREAGNLTATSTDNTASDNSIYIGSETKTASSGRTGEIVIGHAAVGNGSNTTTIGNSNTTKTVLPGGTLTLSGSPPAIESANNQVLLRNTTTGDVSSLVGSTVGQVLKWDGAKWIAGADEGGTSGTGITSLGGLTVSSQSFGQGPGISISSVSNTHTIGITTVPVANGGTGQTTQQAALNALAGAVTSGQYLRGNGTNVTMSAIQAADVPTLNQNTTGTASNVTGVVAAANGGTGLSSYAVGDLIQATGSTTLSRLASVASGNVLLSGGVTTASSWGKVGLTTHVTGTLPIANGGTNTTTAPTIGQTLIASSTTTYTPTTPSYYSFGTTATSGTLTVDAGNRSSGVYRITNTSTSTINIAAITNAVTGGVYSFHISGASNSVIITLNWNTTSYKDLALSNYGTRVYTTPTIITCYHDGTQFVCE